MQADDIGLLKQLVQAGFLDLQFYKFFHLLYKDRRPGCEFGMGADMDQHLCNCSKANQPNGGVLQFFRRPVMAI